MPDGLCAGPDLRRVLLRSIFISYRREDSQGEAGRLFDDLVDAFTDREVFMDVDAIQPGRDFRIAIQQSVQQCRVLLCVIGLDWLTCANAKGLARLADPGDFVRLEIAEALRRDIPVVPVLVRGARMPTLEKLPPDLVELAFRNAVEIAHARWKSDVQVLIRALRPFVADAWTPSLPEPAPSPRPDSTAAQNVPPTAVPRRLQQVAHPPSAKSSPGSLSVATPSGKAANPRFSLGTSIDHDNALQTATANIVSDAPPPSMPPPGLERTAIDRVSKDLAIFIGPIAEIVVKRAAKRCDSLPDLYTLVAKEIEAAPDRARFLAQHTR